LQSLSLPDSKAKHLDGAGIATSVLCAAHCLLAPLLVAMLPLVGLNFLLEETTEWMLVGFSTTLAFVSLVPSYIRRHRRCRPLALFGAGVLLLFPARVWFEEWPNLEVAAAVSGAVFIATAHFLNHRLCRACVSCNDNSE
jgi:MerC mercury resistance protein